jgi:hypothetical protein
MVKTIYYYDNTLTFVICIDPGTWNTIKIRDMCDRNPWYLHHKMARTPYKVSGEHLPCIMLNYIFAFLVPSLIRIGEIKGFRRTPKTKYILHMRKKYVQGPKCL